MSEEPRRLLQTIRDESYRLHIRAIQTLERLDLGVEPPQETTDYLVSDVARWQWAQQVAESMARTSVMQQNGWRRRLVSWLLALAGLRL